MESPRTTAVGAELIAGAVIGAGADIRAVCAPEEAGRCALGVTSPTTIDWQTATLTWNEAETPLEYYTSTYDACYVS